MFTQFGPDIQAELDYRREQLLRHAAHRHTAGRRRHHGRFGPIRDRG